MGLSCGRTCASSTLVAPSLPSHHKQANVLHCAWLAHAAILLTVPDCGTVRSTPLSMMHFPYRSTAGGPWERTGSTCTYIPTW